MVDLFSQENIENTLINELMSMESIVECMYKG